MFARGWFTKGRFLVRKALLHAYIVGEHKGWCKGYEAGMAQMDAMLQAARAEGRAEGLAAKSDGATVAASSDDEPEDEQMEVMDDAEPQRGGGLDVALSIVAMLAPSHIEVPMQAERSL